MSKHNFKVGDRVEMVGDGCQIKKGSICTVTKADEDGWVHVEADDGKFCFDYRVGEGETHELRLIKSADGTTPKAPKSPDITYDTIYLSSDGHQFEEDQIDGKPLADYVEARKLLQRHARLFKKAKA